MKSKWRKKMVNDGGAGFGGGIGKEQKEQPPATGMIKDTPTLREFSTGAHRNDSSGKGDFSLIPALFLRELAEHYQEGAVKKGRNNWKKGLPTTCAYDSATRHLNDYSRGDRSERHLVAAVWNIIVMWYNEKYHSDNPAIYDVEDFK